MILAKFSYFIFIVAMLYLLIAVHSKDWQGYGNMSSSNLTTIWGYIDPRIDKLSQDLSLSSGTSENSAIYGRFATNFSNYLNEQYDLAWNVFVVPTVAGKDVILYGYAFRDHWMWYNGYVYKQLQISFIIWKDYNCKVWVTFDNTEPTGILNSDSVTTAVTGVNDPNNPNTDIWGTTKKFMNNLVKLAGFSGDDKAFTIIAAENVGNTYILGRACLAGARTYHFPEHSGQFYQPNSYWGRFLILQMR